LKNNKIQETTNKKSVTVYMRNIKTKGRKSWKTIQKNKRKAKKMAAVSAFRKNHEVADLLVKHFIC